MACGGNVIVSYLYLGPEQADFVRAMAAAFDATAPCWLKLVIAEDGRTDVSLSNGADRSLCAAQPVWMPGTPAVYTEPLTQPGRGRTSAGKGWSTSSARAMSGRRSCRCWNMSALP